MRKFRYLLISLFVFSLSFIIALLMQRNAETPAEEKIQVDQIQSQLELQLDFVEDVFDELEAIGETSAEDSVCRSVFRRHENYMSERMVSFYVFDSSRLVCWSDRLMPLIYDDLPGNEIVIKKKPNGYYIMTCRVQKEKTFVATILLQRIYEYDNPYLPEGFPDVYNLPEEISVTTNPDKGSPVHLKGQYLFSLVAEDQVINDQLMCDLSAFLFLLAFLGLLTAMYFGYGFIAETLRQPNWLFLALVADLVLLRFLILYFDFPATWMQLELFSPIHYAESVINDSLGGILINAILAFFFALLFHKHFRLRRRKLPEALQMVLALVVSAVSLLIVFYSLMRIQGIIQNSNIPFDFKQLLELNYFSYTGLAVGLILLIANGFIIDRLMLESRKLIKPVFWKISGVFFLVLIPVINWLIADQSLNIVSLLSLIGLVYVIAWIGLSNKNISYYILLLYTFLLALLITSFFSEVLNAKKEKQSKVLALNLSNERDAGAEYFIGKMNTKLCEDDKLIEELNTGDYDKAYDYFQDKYLAAYLSKFNFQLSLCDENDSLIIEPDNVAMHCQKFFDSMLETSGILIPGTDFYFLDNNNGRISYLGAIPVAVTDSLNTILYVELDSRVHVEGPGYPELLLEKSLMPKKYSGDISYAKYYMSNLISSKGDYEYSLQTDFKTDAEEFFRYRKNGYTHLVYNPDTDNFIIISRETEDLQSYSIFFTYIFFILFMLMNVVYLIVYFIRRHKRGAPMGSLKNRFQTYLVLILSLSIIVIGTVSIIFYIQKYRDKQKDNIEEKMQSVLVELNHKLGHEQQLDKSMEDYLNYLLVKFSNVFYTDINLFDTGGRLLASSRMELYEKGLVGKRMSPDALYRIRDNGNNYFVQNETIGEMDYLSAYLPFRNENGEILAYINLPYFARQQDFSQEISSLTVALLNVYLILFILVILIAIFTSNQLTRPLKMIENSLRKMDISRRNRKISYTGDDELGSLVQEYNRKVDELAESAEKLARSEREFAWREMAKQIAHEIKNPLTPMKLSVQHLEKAYKDNDPDLDYMVDKVSKTLIEQIDSLSNIATEFSNFAKIQLRKREKLDLKERIERVKQLFSGLSSTVIDIRDNVEGEAIIMADKEQIMRVLNNLIKNALQSIPDHRTGIVRISLDDKGDHYLLEIADNGVGIPEDMHDKIFSPNFTTKTSGMGLGLSIVKGIVDNMQGNIYFETKTGSGTSFFVELKKF
ncbi:MAG: ATP-binding protein [Bacteroidota bacterium]